MINEIFSDTKLKMDRSVDFCNTEIAKIRTGRATSSMLDMIKVDYYGTLSPISNIAHVSIPEPQTIVIQPFDPNSLETIENAITSSDIGLNPNNDGNVIRLSVPPLTEERRKEYIKVVHKLAEDGRIAIRNIRRDANDTLKKLEKDHELSEDNLKRALDNIQETTDEYIKKINAIQEFKEKEILN
tara:strand:- start:30 stop:584 length:555 start_codon:yes stop_codon:yes gene_type:complete